MNRQQRRALAAADRKGGGLGFIELSPPSVPVLDRRAAQGHCAVGPAEFFNLAKLSAKAHGRGENCFLTSPSPKGRPRP